MQIVIDISEEEYAAILGKADIIRKRKKNTLEGAVLSGAPLPKGHGRLIDADRLKSIYSINLANFNTVIGIQKWIDDAHTIIEADKEE